MGKMSQLHATLCELGSDKIDQIEDFIKIAKIITKNEENLIDLVQHEFHVSKDMARIIIPSAERKYLSRTVSYVSMEPFFKK